MDTFEREYNCTLEGSKNLIQTSFHLIFENLIATITWMHSA